MAKQSADTADKKQIGSAFDLLGKSWEIVKNNWQAFAAVNIFVILGAIASSFNIESKKYDETSSGYQAAGSLAGLEQNQVAAIVGAGIVTALLIAVVGVFLAVMTASLEVKTSAGKKPSLNELFSDGKKYFFRFIGLCLLLGIVIVFCFCLIVRESCHRAPSNGALSYGR